MATKEDTIIYNKSQCIIVKMEINLYMYTNSFPYLYILKDKLHAKRLHDEHLCTSH